MKKVLTVGLFLTLLVFSMAGGAYAIQLDTATNTAAIEALSATRTISYAKGVNNAGGMVYTLGSNLTSGSLVKVSFSGGVAFTGAVLDICAANNGAGNNALPISTQTTTSGGTSQSFVVNNQGGMNLNVGDQLWLAPTGSCDSGVAGNNIPLNLLTSAATLGIKNATFQIQTNAGATLESASNGIINVVSEYPTNSVNTLAMTIDYLGTVGNGTRFTWGGSNNQTVTGGAAANMFRIAPVAVDYSAGNAGAVNSFQLVSQFLVTMPSTTDWSGITTVYGSNNANCSNATGSLASNYYTPTAGNAVNMTFSQTSFNNAAGAGNNIGLYQCAVVDGTTELNARSLTGTYQVNWVSGNPNAAASGTFQTWAPNGYQAYVPNMRWDASNLNKTYVRIVNRGGTAVGVQVLVQTDGTQYTAYDLGSLPANGIVTYSAYDIAAGLGITDKNFGALFIVKGAINNFYSEAYFNLVRSGAVTTRSATLYENGAGKAWNVK
jgi:hypothetical protein